MFDVLFSPPAIWFTIPALLGALVFFLKIVLMVFAGIGPDLDAGQPDVVDVNAHGDTTSAFQIFSFQSIMAGLMGFGVAGLGGLEGLGLNFGWSFLIGVLGGAAFMAILGAMLRGVSTLATSGNVSPSMAIGQEADVYVTIPAKGQGRGQVKLVISGRQRIYTADSTGPEIASQRRARIVAAHPDSSVTVEAV
jgi:hypothetical protein